MKKFGLVGYRLGAGFASDSGGKALSGVLGGSLLVSLVALWIIWPLLQPGYIPTHDGEFSMIRIWQFSKMIATGHLIPRWAPDLNSGYGVPLFIFYYPLPYYVGSFFHVAGLSLVDSFKATLALSYSGAALVSFFWLRKLFNPWSAVIGSFLFMTVPYWFVDLYVRGSVGEVMAIGWLVAGCTFVEYRKPRLLAGAVAALVLSHNIAAAMFFPILIGYVALRQRRFLPSILWGLGLSSFFWMPATGEQNFVTGLSNFDFRDHFPQFAQLLVPSWGTGFSRPGWPADEMSQQVGIITLIMLVVSAVLVRGESNKAYKKAVLAGLALAGVMFFFMLEASLPVWEKITPLRFIQYPWRLLSYFIPITGLLGGYVSWKMGPRMSCVLVGISLFLVAPYMRPVVYEPRSDAYYLSRREFTDGTTTVGNSFSTAWLPWQKERAKQTFERISGKATLASLALKPAQYTLRIDGSTETILQAHVSYYPGWIVLVDGVKKAVEEQNGLIRFSVPAGSHTVVLRFSETPLRLVSDMVSLLSLFWLLGSAILEREYAYRHRRVTP